MNKPTYRPAGSLDIATALAPYNGVWNSKRAAHLLRRAGFGGTPTEIAQVASGSMNAAVDRLVRFPDTSMLGPAPELEGERPGALFQNQQRNQQNNATPAAARMRRRFIVAPGDPTQPMTTDAVPAPMATMNPDDPKVQIIKKIGRARQFNSLALNRWWIGRMIASPAPLQEKMTLFYHGHFTSQYPGKGITAEDILRQNQLYRSYALGNVRKLTLAVSQDPAMLKYLDADKSVKGHANENYARELMELFTLGIGNYTEADIRESARSFTGWTVDRRSDTFINNPGIHDDGTKTFLGKTGNFSGNDIVAIIFAQPAASRWFANKLLSFFVYNDPEPALVDAVAALIKKNDFELAPVMSILLRSNVFYSDRAYRALVKSPTELVVGAYRLLGQSEVAPTVIPAMNRMGQRLFYPPNVKGWDGGEAWLSTNAVLTRENFCSAATQSPTLMQSATWLTANLTMDAKMLAARLIDGIVQGDASAASRLKVEAYLEGADSSALGALSGENIDERLRGAAYLAMAMPAYQLN